MTKELKQKEVLSKAAFAVLACIIFAMPFVVLVEIYSSPYSKISPLQGVIQTIIYSLPISTPLIIISLVLLKRLFLRPEITNFIKLGLVWLFGCILAFYLSLVGVLVFEDVNFSF